MQFSSMPKLLFSHCLCLSLLLPLQGSGSFYRIIWEKRKKEKKSYLFIVFLYRRASTSFQCDMVSALSLNQENCWMALGEGSLVE